MSIPYVGYSTEQLRKMPAAKKGTLVECKICGKDHPLKCGKNEKGDDSSLMFYRCGAKSYIGAISGKFVFGVKPICSWNF